MESFVYVAAISISHAAPNVCVFRGARNGRTVGMVASSLLHLTTVGGQTGRGQGAGGGHFVGAGQRTSGHRGLGQGGHSPASFLQDELSMITGWGFGMLLLSTYLLRSGTGGHSVFSIYWLRSGMGGQGGTWDFNTYLLMSGSRQGGQGATEGHFSCALAPHPQGAL